MSRAAVIADVIRTQARQLKMPGLARSFEDMARQAREEHWAHEDYLHEVLSVEIASRSESAVKQRLRTAAFPEMKTLDQFDFAATEGVAAPKIAELARGDWVGRAENVLLAGPIGTGKTHLAIALGIEAARQRRRIAFWHAADLVRTLVEARDAKELGRYQRRLDRVDVLIVDEVGFVPFERHGGELLFNVLAVRYTLGIWDRLMPFLDHPEVWLDNNRTERGIRGPVIGRRNHFGSKSARGTEVAAILYTLVESAKAAAIDPIAYLTEVATRAKETPGTILLPADFGTQSAAA